MFQLLKKIALICLFFSIGFAQDRVALILRAGTLSMNIDPVTGNFGMLDSSQKNFDLASILFGGEFPSSHFVITIDGVTYNLSEFRPEYPLSLTLGAQVDGIFSLNDVGLELAFFAMNYGESPNPNAIGSALRITNRSRGQTKRISVKYMLDTDIGEPRGRSMMYLPSGENITNSVLIKKENATPYFFLGEPQPTRQYAQGDGYYIYPNISTNLPDAVVIANWKRINNKEWIPTIIPPALNYDSTEIIDMGAALYFGEFIIQPGQYQDIGFAVSKERSIVSPIIEDRALNKGVFDPMRFDFAALFSSTNTRNSPQLFVNPVTKMLRPTPNLTNNDSSLVPSLLSGDAIWKTLFELNSEIKIKEQEIDKSLK